MHAWLTYAGYIPPITCACAVYSFDYNTDAGVKKTKLLFLIW